MENIIIGIQLFVALTMIGFILMQKSEGGGLVSQNASQSLGKILSKRSASNFLTRTTALLATAFMGLCLLLAILSGYNSRNSSLIDKVAKAPAVKAAPSEKVVTKPVVPSKVKTVQADTKKVTAPSVAEKNIPAQK